MSPDRDFDARMMQYSEEALKEREQEFLRRKQLALWSKIRSVILGILFISGCVLGGLYHATIRDAVAKLFESAPTEDSANGKVKLREVMEKAKEHAATVDSIMDGKEPPKSP